MNIVLLEEEYYSLKNEVKNIKIKKQNLTLEIEGNVILNDLESIEDCNLTIILKDNSNLTFNRFSKDITKLNTKIIVNNNTKLNYNHSIYTRLETYIEVIAEINGNNNDTNLNVYGVTNENGNLKILATGDIKKEVSENNMLENVRILSLNNTKNIIYPNLLVSSDKVSVNHNATISGLNEENLFYLTSKSLSKEEASNLLVRGFILSKLQLKEEEKENIKF